MIRQTNQKLTVVVRFTNEDIRKLKGSLLTNIEQVISHRDYYDIVIEPVGRKQCQVVSNDGRITC